jgi:hypothetical protein
VRVAYAFVQAEDPQRGRVGAQRTDLLRPVLPGESASVPLSIRTPSKPGDYNLRIELIQELVQWFADRGADTITLPVHVGPPGTAPADPASASSGPANAPDRR